MLLRDEEWAAWSDGAIGRACEVSDRFVASVRVELSPKRSEMVAPRLVTRNGTTYTQDTTNIGRKPKPEPVTPTAPAPAAPEPRADERMVRATHRSEQPEDLLLVADALASLLSECDRWPVLRGVGHAIRQALVAVRRGDAA